MTKRIAGIICVALVLCVVLGGISYSVEAETTGKKVKNFWQRLFNYPANVTQESAKVVAETGKRGTAVTTKEVKRVGQVTSGELGKTKELVTEPLTGTAETAVKAIEETANIPVEAAKEEPVEAPTQQ